MNVCGGSHVEPKLIGSVLPEDIQPLPSTRIYLHVAFDLGYIKIHFVDYSGRTEEAIFDVEPDDATGPDERLAILATLLSALGKGLAGQHLPVHVQRVWSHNRGELPLLARYLDLRARSQWDITVTTDVEQWVDRPSYRDVLALSTIELAPHVWLH